MALLTTRDREGPAAPLAGANARLVVDVDREWGRPAAEKVAAASVGGGCDVSGLRADVDGDGRSDVVLAYLVAASCRQAVWPWRVRVRLARGGVLDQPLPYDPQPGEKTCCVMGGAADLDGDGRDEFAIGLGHGASESWFGVFRLAGRRVVRVDRDDGSVLLFYGGGSVTHGADVFCRARPRGGTLIVTSRYGVRGGEFVSYGHTEEAYAFDGEHFRLHGSRWWIEAKWPSRTAGPSCFGPSGDPLA